MGAISVGPEGAWAEQFLAWEWKTLHVLMGSIKGTFVLAALRELGSRGCGVLGGLASPCSCSNAFCWKSWEAGMCCWHSEEVPGLKQEVNGVLHSCTAQGSGNLARQLLMGKLCQDLEELFPWKSCGYGCGRETRCGEW